MHWYLVHTKPRQEKCALENLQRQGYPCYLPTLPSEKIRQSVLTVTDEPLFPRYLFIRLGQGESAQSWAPIRSTKGVSRLVSFGSEPAKVSDSLVEALRAQEASAQAEPERLFKPGERVCLTEAPFAGMEGIYQLADGAVVSGSSADYEGDRQNVAIIEQVGLDAPCPSVGKAWSDLPHFVSLTKPIEIGFQ